MHVNKSTFEVLRENFLGSESMLTAVGQDSGRVARTGAPSQTLFTNIISEKRNLGKKLDTWYRQHNNAMVQMNRDQRPLYVSLMKTATKRKKLEVERERRRQERARQLAKELPPIVESGANSDVLDLTKKTATQPSHNNDGKAQPAALVVEGHIGQDFIGTENNPENPENSPGSPFLDVPDSFNRGRRKSSVQEETASLLSSLQKTYDLQPSSGEDVLRKDDSKVQKTQDKEGTNDTKKKKRNRYKKERTSKKTLPPLDDRLQDENMSLNSKLSEDDDSSVSERTTVDGRPQTTDQQENILPSLPSDDVIDVVTASNDPESRLDDKNDNSENRTSSSVENTKERQKESKKKKDKDQGKQSRKNSTGAKHLHVPQGSVCGSSSTGSLWRKKKKKRQDNYEVTVYKKEANGDLTPEQKQISTKVDIYEYFKVPQRRERLTRQKLLEDVRKKEQQQREKVSSFLKKIDEEDNQQPVIVVERQDDDSGGGLLMRQSKRLLAPTPRDTLTAQMNEMEKIRTHCRYVRIYHRPSELQDWQRKGPRLTSWAPNAKDAL
ncbi:Hypp3750 [Branchiostoma lanceolatum]|uniref:Hypp3750 protein n=1 Tax=Branchiostoma lanceolatum TaxID=7740 RepID=A0A8K0EV25_BRALA|nr:Hypp3750 [Branchiostoma lanceolatum]